jgi:flagella basal body P-ring formation protein FlgA
LVPILLRDVRRGEILGPEHFDLRKARVGQMGGLEPLSGPALLGAVAQLDLPAGSTVTSRDVQRARLVKSGDTVQVQVRKGAITARTAAIAKADGMSGDRIKLTSVDKSRELSGVVIGRGLVEVELGSSGN